MTYDLWDYCHSWPSGLAFFPVIFSGSFFPKITLDSSVSFMFMKVSRLLGFCLGTKPKGFLHSWCSNGPIFSNTFNVWDGVSSVIEVLLETLELGIWLWLKFNWVDDWLRLNAPESPDTGASLLKNTCRLSPRWNLSKFHLSCDISGSPEVREKVNPLDRIDSCFLVRVILDKLTKPVLSEK